LSIKPVSSSIRILELLAIPIPAPRGRHPTSQVDFLVYGRTTRFTSAKKEGELVEYPHWRLIQVVLHA